MMPPGGSFIFFNCREALDTLRSELDLSQYQQELVELRANSTDLEVDKYSEILGVSFTLFDWDDREDVIIQEGLSLEFANQDFLDRVGPKPVNPGEAIKFDDTGVLKSHLDEEGKLSYTYSERMYDQLPKVIDLLGDNPDTRQAFISIWDPNIDSNRLEKERVPCSIGYLFFRRGKWLSMIYLMRSLDVSGCLPYDLYTSSRLLDYVAEKINAEPRYLCFIVGSLHKFD